MARTIGTDVSAWGDDDTTIPQINFKKMYANGARFTIIRATQGDNYIDPDFEYNWNESKKAGLLRSAYHFLDYRKASAQKQIDIFHNMVSKWDNELPLALDVEKHYRWVDLPPRNILLSLIKESFDILESYGHRVMLYTNSSTIRYKLNPVPDWLLEKDLWLARYLWRSWWDRRIDTNPIDREPGNKPWDKWTFWQYCDNGDGLAYGLEAKEIDLNYFNGSYEELVAYANVQQPPTPKPLTLEEKVEILWKDHYN